jgi:hypothetical protein
MARPRKLTDEEIAAAQVMRLAEPTLPVKAIASLIADRFHVSERTVFRRVLSVEIPVLAANGDSPTSETTPYVGSTAA